MRERRREDEFERERKGESETERGNTRGKEAVEGKIVIYPEDILGTKPAFAEKKEKDAKIPKCPSLNNL